MLLHNVHVLGRTFSASFNISRIPTREARITRYWPRKYPFLQEYWIQYSRNSVFQGTKTGHLFSDVLYDVVFLTNSCEGSNWTVQDIENLPISEQIPLLHRLDHSIHMVRLWVLSRAKYLANNWNMEQFFRVTHVDVNASLYALSQLKVNQS